MSYLDDSKDAGGAMPGSFVTNNTYRGRLYFPKFTEGVTLITPVGVPNEDMTDILPHRNVREDGSLSTTPRDYSDWISCRYLVRGVGTAEEMTFLVSQKDENGNIIPRQAQHSPYDSLYRTWKKMKATNPNLEILGKGSKSAPAKITAPKPHAAIQCVMYQHGKFVMQPHTVPALLMFGGTAKNAFEDLLEEESEAFAALSPDEKNAQKDNAEFRFKYPNIFRKDMIPVLSWKGVSGADEGTVSVDNLSYGGPTTYASQAPGKRDKRDFSRYVAELTFRNVAFPTDQQGRLQIYTHDNAFTPWDQCFRYLSDDEMADMVVRAFRDVPFLLIPAFQHRPEWLPDSITKGQVVYPATGQQPVPQQYAPPVQQPQVAPPQYAPQQPQGAPPQYAPQQPQYAPQPQYQVPGQPEAQPVPQPGVPPVTEPAADQLPYAFPEQQQPQVQPAPQQPAPAPQQAGGLPPLSAGEIAGQGAPAPAAPAAPAENNPIQPNTGAQPGVPGSVSPDDVAAVMQRLSGVNQVAQG